MTFVSDYRIDQLIDSARHDSFITSNEAAVDVFSPTFWACRTILTLKSVYVQRALIFVIQTLFTLCRWM